jgi:hypothetical protein
MRFFSLIQKILSLTLHTVSLLVLALVTAPIAKWYLTKVPALGVDLYYTATYVAQYLKHFSFPFSGYKDIWFGGYPIFRDIFQLHFYAIMPFAKFLGLIEGIRLYVMVSLFLLVFFSYLLFYQLSKNIILALVLALTISYSANSYGAATWGGSIPYFATQFFFPLTLVLLWKFKTTNNWKWFWLAALVSGIAALGHPLPVVSFIVPGAFLIIFLYIEIGTKYNLVARIYQFFLFSLSTILISLRIFYPIILNSLKGLLKGDIIGLFRLTTGSGGSPAQVALSAETAAFYKSLAKLIITDTANLLFYLMAGGTIFFLISIVFWPQRLRRFLRTLPFLAIAVFVCGQIWANANGFAFLFQGWYRQFWAVPIAIGALTAILFGQFFEVLNLKFSETVSALFKTFSKFAVLLIVSATIAIVGYNFFRTQAGPTIKKIEAKSELSSTYPEIISVKTDEKSQNELKAELIPEFLSPGDKNKRLYVADATVNIWWNVFYDLPQVRGYLDPPIATSERGGFFWTDIAIANDTIVLDFGIPEDIAYNNALFLIDWYGIYYFEGGRLGSKGPSPGPSSYLLKNNVFEKEEEVTTYGAILKYQTASGLPELHMDIPQTLKFYKIKDELTSPILYPTDAPRVIVFSNLAGYEDILRILASRNLNSQKIIPVYGGKDIDEFDLERLSDFDAIILHGYSYHNREKTFNSLSKYVLGGGKVFIDTGAETKESNSSSLPEIFPFRESVREGVGRDWELEVGQTPLLEGVDVSKFGPLIFNQDEWKLVSPRNVASIKEGSEVILSNKGLPVLIRRRVGKGDVIWSGLNLAYHYNQYKSDDEAELFINIIREFVSLDEKSPQPAKTEWLTPEKVRITGQGISRGILFKEQGYDGWRVKVNGKRLPIYLTGPTFPGFMYVSLANLSPPYNVEFKYSGTLTSHLVFVVSILTTILILEKTLFSGVIFGRRLEIITQGLNKKIKSWWEKEEE